MIVSRSASDCLVRNHQGNYQVCQTFAQSYPTFSMLTVRKFCLIISNIEQSGLVLCLCSANFPDGVTYQESRKSPDEYRSIS